MVRQAALRFGIRATRSCANARGPKDAVAAEHEEPAIQPMHTAVHMQARLSAVHEHSRAMTVLRGDGGDRKSGLLGQSQKGGTLAPGWIPGAGQKDFGVQRPPACAHYSARYLPSPPKEHLVERVTVETAVARMDVDDRRNRTQRRFPRT